MRHHVRPLTSVLLCLLSELRTLPPASSEDKWRKISSAHTQDVIYGLLSLTALFSIKEYRILHNFWTIITSVYKELETIEQMNKGNAKSASLVKKRNVLLHFFHLIVLKLHGKMKCLIMISDSVSSSFNKDARTAVVAVCQYWSDELCAAVH